MVPEQEEVLVRSRFCIFKALILTGILMQVNAVAFAYDRYAPVFESQPEAPSGYRWQHTLVYPFELVRRPIDKTLVYLEDHKIPRKAVWMYDKLQENGISPRLHSVNSIEVGAGTEIDWIRLTRLRERLPGAVLNSWVDFKRETVFEAGATVGAERIAGTGLRTLGTFKYEDRVREHFYGIGPHTSRGDGYVYGIEQTTLEADLGYAPNPEIAADLKIGYRNVNINGGKDGGSGQVGEGIFNEGQVNGLRGDSLMSYALEFAYDTRNNRGNSTMGGLHRATFSYNHGLNSSDAGYFKYTAEASRYFSLKSKRRVLAVHFYGEHNDKIGNDYVPFHQMPMLGGYDSFPSYSHTLRGYDASRFKDESLVLLNIEYRYTIWENRDLKLDTVLFWDEGQVFQEFSELQFGDFRGSYGLGFRVSLADVMLVGAEMAFGSEGKNFYVKRKTPF